VSEPTFSHLDDAGNARMVNVGDKDISQRRAVAQCSVQMSSATAAAIRNGAMKKGDVLGVARVAGIQAAKKTSDLIPLCHPIMISGVTVDFVVTDSSVDITATVTTVDRTGVEMEALTACSVAALTVYDMCKSADKDMVITNVALWEKDGGRSGSYRKS
jgi:cyclic pyranopterin phosphate synthase